jgi:hypothetical protein
MAFQIIAINLPFPLRDLFGDNFCKGIRFPATFYTFGSVIWGCFIALFRVLYIKAQNWTKYQVGEDNLLVSFIVTGSILNVAIALAVTVLDEHSYVHKMCTHQSQSSIDMLLELQVFMIILNTKPGLRPTNKSTLKNSL